MSPLHNAVQFFTNIISRPFLFLLLGLAFIVASAAGLKHFTKDPTVDSFIPQGHASVVARDRVQDVFGLNDPIIVALDTGKADGIYTADALNALLTLQDLMLSLDNVRRDRVTSILSETSISGDGFSLNVEDIGERSSLDASFTEGDAARVKTLTDAMPIYKGILVSDSGASALIVAELVDQDLASDTYRDLLAVIPDLSDKGFQTHVAGMGAVSGYLSQYIDQDARKLQPLIFVVIILILYSAFGAVRAVIAPLFVIIGAAIGTIGIMSWFQIPYFPITSALPVVIVAIAVADSLHVLTAYFELRVKQPHLEAREAIIDAMADIWVPITLTTLTSIAGFIGLAVASIMPPIKYFGLFAALGVFLAWAFTVFVLPNLILMLNLQPSKRLAARITASKTSLAAPFFNLSRWCAYRPLATALIVGVCTVVAITGATSLRVDRMMVDHFHDSETIRKADSFINTEFAGTSYLDVMISAQDPQGLFSADLMDKVADLQTYMEGLPGVSKTLSMVDYFEILHASIDPESSRPLPDQDFAYAQYMLLHESSADPDDFEEEIDSSYQNMLVRAYIRSGYYSRDKEIVKALETYLAANFSHQGVTPTISGRVNVDYHWMNTLGDSHFQSVAITLVLVLMMSSLLFKQLRAGLVAVAPVFLTVIGIYALMGSLDIYLEPATSMFASIAIGIGIDFAIHLIDRIKLGLNETACNAVDAIEQRYEMPVRACLFNAVALALGFSVLMASQLMTLQNFGALVAFAAIASFIAALVIVPMAFGLLDKFRASSNASSLEKGLSS